MANSGNAIPLLSEKSDVNNRTPYFVGEEIICTIPADIEVIPVNNQPGPDFYKPPSVKKRPRPKNQTPPRAKRKLTDAERAGARTSKIQQLITLPESTDDSFIDFCGLQVPVKTLLQNADIRKQLEPFIEEIIITDTSDESDIEEIEQFRRKNEFAIKQRNKPAKPRNKKRKKSPEPIVQESTGPFVEVLIPEADDSTQLIQEDIIVNLPFAIEKDAIKDTQEKYALEKQIQLITDSSDDERTVKQNTSGFKKQTFSKEVNEPMAKQNTSGCKKQTLTNEVNDTDRSKNNLIHKKLKVKNIPDSEVVVLDNATEENAKEASIMESDDWYYLNMATTSKTDYNLTMETDLREDPKSRTTDTSKVNNNLTMTTPSKVDDNSTAATTLKEDQINTNCTTTEKDVDLDQVLSDNESEIETKKPRKRKKRRRIPWSRHAIKGKKGSKNVKAKLQGKIVKGGINIAKKIQNTTAESESASPLSDKPTVKNSLATSVSDKTNVSQDISRTNRTPVVQEKNSFADSDKIGRDIKQEPMLESNDETSVELLKIYQSNKEMDENQLLIKLEQEVSWNTNVNDPNSNQQKNLEQLQSTSDQLLQKSVAMQQRRSKLIAKRLYTGRKRSLGKCDNCGRKYKRLEALRRHQLMCKVNYNCAMCTFFTSDKIAFREHLTNHIFGSVNTYEEEQTNDSISDSTCPLSDSIGLTNDLKDPSYDSIDPANDSIEQARTSTSPLNNLTDPADDSIDLANDSIEQASISTSPLNNLTDPADDSIDLANDSIEQASISTSPLNNLTNQADDSIEQTGVSTSPLNNPIDLVNDTTAQAPTNSNCGKYTIVMKDVFGNDKYLGYTEFYRCKICKQLFNDYASLRKHILLSLQGAQLACLQSDTNRCNRCGAHGFLNKCELRCHMVTTCTAKKVFKIPYVKLERCKIPEKSKIEVQRWIKYYCLKCLTTNTAPENETKCRKCLAKLSFMCQVCRDLFLTYSGLRTHMTYKHNIDLNDSKEECKVSEQKCLSIENEKLSRANKSLLEKEHKMKDAIGNIRNFISSKVPVKNARVNTASIENSKEFKSRRTSAPNANIYTTSTFNANKPLKTYSKTDQSLASKQVVNTVTTSEENEKILSGNNKTTVPIASQIIGFDKKINHSEKQASEIETVKNIKVIYPIKPNDKKLAEVGKQVVNFETPKEINSINCLGSVKMVNQDQKQTEIRTGKTIKVIYPIKPIDKKLAEVGKRVDSFKASDEINSINYLGSDKIVNQNQKQSEVKIGKTIKVIYPIKPINKKLAEIDKQVASFEAPQEINSINCINSDKTVNQNLNRIQPKTGKTIKVIYPINPIDKKLAEAGKQVANFEAPQEINSINRIGSDKMVNQNQKQTEVKTGKTIKVIYPTKPIDKKLVEVGKQITSFEASQEINSINCIGSDKMVNPNQKQTEAKTDKNIKVIYIIKPIDKKSTKTSKQDVIFEIPQQNNSTNCTNKYDQYSKKAEINKLANETNYMEKSLNKNLDSSTTQKQYFSNDNGISKNEESKNDHFKSLKRNRLETANQIMRFCIKCDKTKKYDEKIRMGWMIEICKKCKMQLLYQCRNCRGICKDYQKMAWHVICKCKPRLRYFSVSQKAHLRKILERRYALLEAERNVLNSIEFES